MAWPPRSPDFTPIESFLRPHFEALFYTSTVNSEDSLISRIVKAKATIRQHPDMIEFSRQSLLPRRWRWRWRRRRRRLFIEVDIRTFEHVLRTATKYYFSSE